MYKWNYLVDLLFENSVNRVIVSYFPPLYFTIGIAMSPDRAAVVAAACIVLHNMGMLWKMPSKFDDDKGNVDDEVPQDVH